MAGKYLKAIFAPRSRAAVARWAHNPKVGSSILPFATTKALERAFFMFTVYVMYSAKFEKIYIGYTSDLLSRFRSHNELATKGWAIKFRPWQIVHTEIFESKFEAIRREKQLKTANGREWIWRLITGLERSSLISAEWRTGVRSSPSQQIKA